jgi:hypothetical protein
LPAPGHAATTRYRALGVQHGIDALAATDGGALFVAHQTWLYAVDATGNRQLVHSLPASHQFGAMTFEPRSGAVLATDWTARILIAHFPGGSTQALGPGAREHVRPRAGTGARRSCSPPANPNWPSPGAWPGIWAGRPADTPARADSPRRCFGPAGHHRRRQLDRRDGQRHVSGPAGQQPVCCAGARRNSRARSLAAPCSPSPTPSWVGPPFDGAYDLAHDDRGQIYVSDGLRGQLWQVDLASGARARACPCSPPAAPARPTWRGGAARVRPLFAPYQPAGGGELLAVVADWASVQSEAVAITAQRPGLTVQPGNPVPHGAAAVLAEGLAPNAPSALFVSPLPAQPEQALPFAHGHAALAGPRRAHRAVGLAGQRRRPGPRKLVVLAPAAATPR